MNDESRIARAERAHAEAQARRDEARARHGQVAGELAEAERAWGAATLETMEIDDFARLGARVELLRRAATSTRSNLDAAERRLSAAHSDLATVRQSVFAAQERLDRALRNGNASSERDARRQLAALVGEAG